MEALDLVPQPAGITPRRPHLTLVRSTPRPTGTTPRTAQDTHLIRISFELYEDEAPAVRSAIEEISNEIGGRLEGMYPFPQEAALTRAARGLGKLRAAVTAAVPSPDADYRGRR